jgi:hypothetical protein
VIDITNPASPTLAGSYDTPGGVFGVAISGDYAYVGDYGSGLQVIDIADPVLPPLFAGSYDTPVHAIGVATTGDYAYVADYTSGVQVIDISNPTSPALVSSYDTPGTARDVAIAGDYAYVADEYSGLQVIDISDPTSPTLAGSCDTPDRALRVATSGDHAYVGDGYSGGLQVIDISDPTSPTLAGSCDTPDQALGVAISGDYAYVADYDSGLQVMDISDPTGPTLAGSYNTPYRAWGVAISGDYAYVADGTSGLQVIDISDPASPTLAGSYNTPGFAYAVVIAGDYAYVADRLSGLQVIDISNPASPIPAGSYITPDFANGVAISGDYAYVAVSGSGLQVIEVFQRRYDTQSNTAQSLTIDEADEVILKACLNATYSDSIRWELSADSGGSWQEFLPGAAYQAFIIPGSDLLWRSTHFYAGRGINPSCTHLEIEWVLALVAACVDIDPDVLNPRSAGRWVTSYIELPEGYDPADIDASTVLLNETVPAEPEPTSVGDYDEDGLPDRTVKFSRSQVIDILPNGDQVEVRVGGEVAGEPFAGADTIRVLMPKVTYPNGGEVLEVGQEPAITWETPPGYEPGWYDVYYTADDGQSWNMIAENVEGTSCPWIITDVISDRCLVLVEAYDAEGIMGYDLSDEFFTICSMAGVLTGSAIPTQFALHPVRPNPLSQEATIRFDLPETRHVRLTIHDVQGRLVRELIAGVRSANSYMVIWDASDSSADEVPPGIYFVRLQAGDQVVARKIVLIR